MHLPVHPRAPGHRRDRLERVFQLKESHKNTDLLAARTIRDAGLVKGTLWNGAARLFTIACNAIQVPLILTSASSEIFGVWSLFIGFTQLLGFADMGIGLGLQHEIAKHYANNDDRSLAAVYATARITLSVFACFIAVIALAMLNFGSFASAFQITDNSVRNDLPYALAALLICFFGGVVLSLATRLAAGLQLSWITSVFSIIGGLVSLTALWACGRMHLGLSALVLASLAPPALSLLGVPFALCRINQRYRPYFTGSFDSRYIRPLLSTGIGYVVPQLAATFIHQFPLILAGTTLGPKALVPFAVTHRLSYALLQFQQLPLFSLWPAYSEAIHRLDFGWIRNLFRKSIRYGFASAIVVGISIAFLGKQIIAIWTPANSILPSNSLLYAFGVWITLVGSMGGVFMLVNGCAKLVLQSIGSVIAAGALFFAAPRLISVQHPENALYAAVISCSLFLWPLVLYEARGLLRSLRHG